MPYTRLFLWVEGSDDERFVSGIVKPLFESTFDSVQIIQYAGETKKKVNNFLKSIHAMNASYIFFKDNDSPCITADKEKTTRKYSQLHEERLLIVVKEIESWYLAGLDENSSQHLTIPYLETTNSLSKEQFDNLIPNSFESRIDFMIEIIKTFSLHVAKTKNNSFKYFTQKYIS